MGTDADNSLEKRLAHRSAHLARLKSLNAAGRLLTAGPMPLADATDQPQAGFSGSIIIAEFNSLEDAKAWANADPYIEGGVYQHVTVTPFIKVF